MISVLILTKNEKRDLPGALASVAWSADPHGVVSRSSGGPDGVAQAAGARVHQRAFDNYAEQRNFGLFLPFAHPWLFILDADERPTDRKSTRLNSSHRCIS